MKHERLNSYQDVYVSACGQPFQNRRLGLAHEKECTSCAIACEAMRQEKEQSLGLGPEDLARDI